MADDGARLFPFFASGQMQDAFQLDGTCLTAIESDVSFGDHVTRPKVLLVLAEDKMRHSCTAIGVQQW